jgi:MFS family permease
LSTPVWAPLRRPFFRRFLLGAFGVNLSNQVLQVAAGWHLYDQTHSAWSLAMVGLMNYLPILALSLPAGWAADHFDRRRVLAVALVVQAGAALALFTLVLLQGPVWGWYPLLFMAAAGRALQTPAAVSLYPMLVDDTEVPRAVSFNSVNFQAGAVLGPILAGLLLYRFGTAVALGFVALGPLVNLAIVPTLGFLRQPQAPLSEPLKMKILGGFHFVWEHQAIFGALSMDFVAVLFGGVDGILPMFAKDLLHCGQVGLGFLKAAIFLGAFITSMALIRRPNLKRTGHAMLTAVAGFGACMLVFAWSRNLALSFGALVAAGMFDQVSVYVRQSLVQLRTPEQLRGRVQAANFLFIGSSNELGEFESGVTAGWLGPVGSVVLGGVAVLVTVATWSVLFKELRQLDSLTPQA